MRVISYYDSDNKKHWLNEIKKSDWSASAFLHKLLCENTFFNVMGERSKVLLLTDGDKLISHCTFSEIDDIQPTELTPWVGFVYTFPEYRKNRYAGLLFDEVERLAKAENVPCVYLSTNHKGLYEKYGFKFFDVMNDINGEPSRIYVKRTDYEIKKLCVSQIPEALALAKKVFTQYESPDYSPEGTEEFKKCLHDETYLLGMEYYGAFDGERLVGMLGIRKEKTIITKRLILRRWEESDAEDLYEYAKDPDVGPIAGWQPHKSVEESRNIIKNVLSGPEAYAVCLKEDNRAIGAIELMLSGSSVNHLASADECELGYWIGKPFWGQGLIPEAALELLRRAFEDLGMNTVWCGYFDGNYKSKRVQEKCGFKYQYTKENVDVPSMKEKRTEHINRMTKEEWEKYGYRSYGRKLQR